jgi:hypothetical protein
MAAAAPCECPTAAAKGDAPFASLRLRCSLRWTICERRIMGLETDALARYAARWSAPSAVAAAVAAAAAAIAANAVAAYEPFSAATLW